jgi:hypothetical protein
MNQVTMTTRAARFAFEPNETRVTREWQGLKLTLDASQVFIDDPGQGCPVLLEFGKETMSWGCFYEGGNFGDTGADDRHWRWCDEVAGMVEDWMGFQVEAARVREAAETALDGFKDATRNAVLAALDGVATDGKGWVDADLSALFKAVDAHAVNLWNRQLAANGGAK